VDFGQHTQRFSPGFTSNRLKTKGKDISRSMLNTLRDILMGITQQFLFPDYLKSKQFQTFSNIVRIVLNAIPITNKPYVKKITLSILYLKFYSTSWNI